MNEQEFRKFLKKRGKAEHVVEEVIELVRQFEQYLQQIGTVLDEAKPHHLEVFVEDIERVPKASASRHLWALQAYYAFAANDVMGKFAWILRDARVKRNPFALKEFRGVCEEYADRLAAVGVRNIQQAIDIGRAPSDRQALADCVQIPLETVEEFVKLADLARIPGVKGIRARLYYDAGVDTLDKLAEWDCEALRKMLVEFVERTDFDGTAPLPAEVAFAIAQAKKLPRIVKY